MAQDLKTLQEAIVYFSNPANCHTYVLARRWPDGKVTCPRCGSDNVAWQPKYNRWQCNVRHDRRQFTLKTGTIFEDSPLPLSKWLAAMWQVVNCKNGVSSYEVHRAIGVTQKTAWFMDHRIRRALRMGSFEKMSGEVGGKDKTAVVGFVERGGKVQTVVVENRKKKTLQAEVKKRVEAGAALS